MYVEVNLASPQYFTRTQLSRLHRQFSHPSAKKLFDLIQKARPDEVTPETMENLKEITQLCDPCQRIQRAPVRFRVSLGTEDVQFNERILLNIMYIDGDPVLHIVDNGTKFNAALFLDEVSTAEVWNAIVCCWAMVYTGVSNCILTDQGSQFGEKFISLARLSNVEVSRTGIEAHASLGLVERYHEPLRSTYRKLKAEFPNVNKHVALACAVKGMNDTLGPEGLVPSSLLFGELPQPFTPSENRSDRPSLLDRAKLATAARKEMSAQMAKVKLKRAMHHAVPPACDRSYEPGDEVLVWRERIVGNRIGEWLGPLKVDGVNYAKKLVYVRDVDIGPPRPFNVVQVKPYYSPELLAHSFLCDLDKAFERFKTPTDDMIFLTEVLDPNDQRATCPQMDKAKKKEIRNLL